MKISTLALLAGLAISVSIPVQANILLPGDSKTPDLIATATGTLQAFTSIPFTTPTYSAILNAAVYKNTADPANLVCPAGGCIDFYYQITVLAGSTAAVARTTDFSFSGFATDSGYRTSAPSGGGLPVGFFVVGSQVPLLVDRDLAGAVMGFNFTSLAAGDPPKIHAGQSSVVLEIQTNAKFFVPGTTSVIDGGTKDVPTYAPGTGVPEPMSMLLLGGGLIALASMRRFVSKN